MENESNNPFAGIQDGKKPLSAKKQPQMDIFEDVFRTELDLPDGILEEISALGLEARWLDSQKVHVNQGYHPRGWQVYRRKKTDTIDSSEEFNFGRDPEGVIRRGTMILGVKPKEQADRHRQGLKIKADRQLGHQAKQAQELRNLAAQSGVKTVVKEGDDEE